MQELDPSQIMHVGLGFFASKTLLSAVELGLFTELGRKPLTGAELASALGLSRRAVPDFPDALVALNLLERDGDGPDARYANTPETAKFLDRASPDYVGGLLEMANARLYGFWGDLTAALKTGLPQNESKRSGKSDFASIYEAPERLEQFVSAMAAASAANFRALAQRFDFSRYATLCDVGGASAELSCIVAAAHPHLRCTSLDLPDVSAIAARRVQRAGLQGRITVVSGDFFRDPFPHADVITMGMVLHDWSLEKKKLLIRKAYEALPPGGALVAIETLIDDARRYNAVGLLLSLNMLIEFGEAFDFTGADYAAWCREAGFASVDVVPLAGASSAGIAHKSRSKSAG